MISVVALPEVSSTPGPGAQHARGATRADAPGSGLIRIDGYAAADREYSPPWGKQYPITKER
ncbi:hypothetical protein GCM10010350_10330 [Streptomyces galilaeus]|nr:hypothetical protein GCM10010350_10330 [Streptomyces galilaeus]